MNVEAPREYDTPSNDAENDNVQPVPLLYDIKIKRKKTSGQIKIINIPEEEFLIQRHTKSLDDCDFVAHRSEMTVGDLVAMGCTRCANCEGGPSGRGCPWGLTTTDAELQEWVQQEWGAERLNKYYTALSKRLKQILRDLGLSNIKELRGRTDLLRYNSGSEL